MTREEAKEFLIDISYQLGTISVEYLTKKDGERMREAINTLEQEPCEMTVEEYRQRMMQAFHNADCDELIAICALPTEKEFEHLEWLLKNHHSPVNVILAKIRSDIDFAIKVTDSQDDYGMGMRNGMRYVKSLIDGKEPQYELKYTDKEKKLGIDLGDEVVDDHGVKGVVVGIDTYEGDVVLSLLMKNHKVPQLVKASMYKKTGRHFTQIIKVWEQI